MTSDNVQYPPTFPRKCEVYQDSHGVYHTTQAHAEAAQFDIKVIAWYRSAEQHHLMHPSVLLDTMQPLDVDIIVAWLRNNRTDLLKLLY